MVQTKTVDGPLRRGQLILNGPQGTLYGRNTLAGAINLVTQKPTGQFGGKLEIGIGNFGKRYAQGSLNHNAAAKGIPGESVRVETALKLSTKPFCIGLPGAM